MNASLRARVIAEWRGMPETGFTRDTARPVAETLLKVMAKLQLDDRLREDQMKNAWQEIVGAWVAPWNGRRRHDAILEALLDWAEQHTPRAIQPGESM